MRRKGYWMWHRRWDSARSLALGAATIVNDSLRWPPVEFMAASLSIA
jgi:hypothetical protein